MNRDPLDNLGADQAGLRHLLTSLTSAPIADELSGERAAVAMFQAARAAQPMSIGFEPEPAAPTTPNQDGRTAANRDRARRTGSRRAGVRISAWLAAGATALALAGGFAVAGYAAALPAPLQRVAHRVFGFAGVPNSPIHPHLGSPAPTRQPTSSQPPAGQRSPSQPASSPSARATSHSPSPRPSSRRSASPSPKPGSPSPRSSSPSGSPVPGQGAKLTITASAQQVTAGGSVQLGAVLAEHGQPSANVPLTLFERTPGQGWQQAGHASTDGQGQASFTVPDLATNAAFRVAGPDGAVSGRIVVIVTPSVSASLEPTARHRVDRLVVGAPLAQRGNVIVLEVLTKSGQWRAVRTRRLHQTGQASFTIVVRKVSVSYQAVLLATRKHAQSISNEVTAPGRGSGTTG